MNIVGKYKVKKLGLFDIESGWKMVSVDELMGMEESEEVIQAKEMSETTMVVSEDGTISIRIVPSPETIAEAKAEGEEIPLNEDGTVSLQDFEWKEENGELFYIFLIGNVGQIHEFFMQPFSVEFHRLIPPY